MKRAPAMRSLVLPATLILTLCYGFLLGRYQVFPYSMLSELKNSFSARAESLAPKRQPTYYQKKKMYEMFPGHYEYVMFGDSLTERGKWQDMLPGYNIGNRGIDGDDTAGMRERLEAVKATGTKTVFIMAGTNDLNRHIDPAVIANNILEIGKILSTSGIKVIIQSTIFSGQRLDKKNLEIAKVNEILEMRASGLGLSYLDLNRKLAPDGSLLERYTVDGTHLTAEGYSAWRSVLLDYLKHK